MQYTSQWVLLGASPNSEIFSFFSAACQEANSCGVNVFTMVSGIIPTFGECIPLWTQNDMSLFPCFFGFDCNWYLVFFLWMHLPHWILSIDQDAGIFRSQGWMWIWECATRASTCGFPEWDFSRPGVENVGWKSIWDLGFWIGWEALKLIWGTSHWVSDWVRFYAQLFVASSWSQYTFRYKRTTYIHNHIYIYHIYIYIIYILYYIYYILYIILYYIILYYHYIYIIYIYIILYILYIYIILYILYIYI